MRAALSMSASSHRPSAHAAVRCSLMPMSALARRPSASYPSVMDLLDVASQVVVPAMRAVFRDGEVTTSDLKSRRDNIALSLTVEGETFEFSVVQRNVPGRSREDLPENLRLLLVDFVAESRFGWGENREHGPTA
jgi:hypothetical protein